MIYISHRGNINGPNKEKENSEEYILKAIQAGYDVEIDVWYINNEFWLGHDSPQYKIHHYFLNNSRLWCHAKNFEALIQMLEKKVHCFWHEKDQVTLTSKNYIWAYPNIACKNSIAVLPELNYYVPNNHIGVCSDFIETYKS
jgi:hypothetical protein